MSSRDPTRHGRSTAAVGAHDLTGRLAAARLPAYAADTDQSAQRQKRAFRADIKAHADSASGMGLGSGRSATREPNPYPGLAALMAHGHLSRRSRPPPDPRSDWDL
jgi:hypothetical protein